MSIDEWVDDFIEFERDDVNVSANNDNDACEALQESLEALQKLKKNARSIKVYGLILGCILFVDIIVRWLSIEKFGASEPFRIDQESLDPPVKKYKAESRQEYGEKYHAFNQKNPWTSFCPYAKCSNSDHCRPCDRRFIFEIAIGRSGSTSLLDLINALPGVRLSGENNGMLIGLTNIIYRLHFGSWKTRLYNEDTNHMLHSFWHNRISKGALSCPAQQFVETIDPPDRNEYYNDNETIIGFKTIRMHKNAYDEGLDVKWGEFVQRFDFIRELFPCSRFIINIRNDAQAIVSSVNSQFKSVTEENTVERTEARNQHLRSLHQHLGDASMLVEFEEWTKGPESLNNMAKWLGFRDCIYPNKIPHDNARGTNGGFSKTGYFNDELDIDLGPNCRYVG